MEENYDGLIHRIEELEHRLENGVVVQSQSAQGVKAAASASQSKPELPKAIPEDVQNIIKNWQRILSAIGGITKTYLTKGVPTLGNNGELVIVYDDPNAYEYLAGNRAECLEELKRLAAEHSGKEVEVVIRKNESGHSAKNAVVDLRDIIPFDIEIED